MSQQPVASPGRPVPNQDIGCSIGDQCPNCGGGDLKPEHAHVKCPSCGYIGPCCW